MILHWLSFLLCLRIYICISLPNKHGFISTLNHARASLLQSKGKNRRGVIFSQIEIKMPALSSTMTSGKIIKWNKDIGEYINLGDIIMTVESDKADMDVEAFDEGFLRVKHMGDGSEAKVGDTLGILTTEKDEQIEARGDDSPTGITQQSSRKEQIDVVTQGNDTTETDTDSTTTQTTQEIRGEEKIYVPFVSSKRNKMRIIKWTRKENDYVNKDEILFHVEDDKSTIEVESPYYGIIKEILVEEGQFADFDKPVAIISTIKAEEHPHKEQTPLENVQLVNEENILRHYQGTLSGTKEGKLLLENMSSSDKQTMEERLLLNCDKYNNLSRDFFSSPRDDIPEESSKKQERDTAPPKGRDAPVVLPSAAEMLEQNKLNPEDIKGSKIPGRITYEDVVSHLERTGGATPAKEKIIELTKVQKAIKNNMLRTLSIPVFRITHFIKTNALLKLYEQVKDKISMTVLLSKCVSNVLLKHPLIYSTFIDEGEGKILLNEDIHIGNALGLKSSLLTPVLKRVNKTDIYTLAAEWKKLVEKGKQGLLTLGEMTGSNFYISNLGMFNTYQFDATLPANVSCILSVGTNIAGVENFEELKIQRGMMMTLTCDHRHIYGSHAAAFMSDLAAFVERDIMQIFL
ncbi:dihydrolipoamide acetyltransferase, putative [Plasmodium knowlesi strain H]|uniref:Dihydrolipoamide acetyltransferase component of pyruvate dehydrogenase complex n=3 Tax=Plasmodium knowlesi TaxID=5850 RepID=A0A5K1VJK7_PLAKH|nr:dihydrolipoamide acetyltransferase, putative [Plasmodium knowlesi strain H]OTN68263.1 Dihydrolipoamide acetyltransferase component of pyruvate dehydrogenase complex [Plasmodium knowlesi]CAA9987100.1 dihydrolipoamide acetyltransferase, putative [Plasmodium knowlesi strain H]SBO23837.1 dihydrolipoamide acetyltransferase, putative [Plasmodium knowlesi strain H]SBO25623.1 dihydrolipoamide acetyltransferase, putative [Plasmodium knowlesi strain H]VVS76574.1 dihydrolipoamide acetyltransferase, pu|eukprot:XP_002261722.1 dihydrolipoamide acetyltransferase, putative [Plasmodium knowlesi strain H]